MGNKTCTITYNGTDIAVTTESSDVNIVYNGSTIASAVTGTKTANCNGKVMASNLVIGSKTLQCAGKKMASNVVVKVEEEATTETWVINQNVPVPAEMEFIDTDINYASNGNNYNKFAVMADPIFESISITYQLDATSTEVYNIDSGWVSDAYRTVVFGTAPTGELLGWLNSNAVKQ